MSGNFAADLYRRHYRDKDFERLGLFLLLQQRFGIASSLYPGSFVHLTPSFVFPFTVYADMDKRAKRFFADPWAAEFVGRNKRYEQQPVIRFHAQDYTQELPEETGRFDLLLSQWAGFISRHCKRYLKPGGWLVANDSHGDASLAWMDRDYTFVAAIHQRSGRYRLEETGLESYFRPKSRKEITVESLLKRGRGIAYKHSAWAYVFQLG